MYRTSLLIAATAVLFARDLHAATKADSIVTMTGARTKLAWVRWPWCNNGYTPVQAYAADPGKSYEQNHPYTQLMGYDTQDGQYQFVDSAIGYHCFPRITRKNGNYVIWNDPGINCSWIRDLARTAPKRKLIDGGDYWVVACQYNPVTDSEFIYVFIQYNVPEDFYGYLAGKGVARIPLKSDYTADLTKKHTIVMTAPTPNPLPDDVLPDEVLHSVSASQDGLYMGCNFNIPNCSIYDIRNGVRIDRHDVTQEYGCQTNIAPDNSYRFFHLGDSHTALSMFGPGVAAKSSTPMWYVNVINSAPGSTSNENNCLDPRWANDVRIFTYAYPLETGIASTIFSMSAAQVQAANASRAGSFCIAKFAADFKSVQSAIRVSDGDVRHREGVGDAWVAPSASTVPSGPGVAHRSERFSLKGLRYSATVPSTVAVSDMAGRVLFAAVVNTSEVLDLSSLRNGAYVVTVTNAKGIAAEKVLVQK